MRAKILILILIGLACCIAAGSCSELLTIHEIEDLRRDFSKLNKWVDNRVHKDISPEHYLRIVKNKRYIGINSIDPDLERAMKLFTNLAGHGECNDETLKVMRLVILSKVMVNYTKIVHSNYRRPVILFHYISPIYKKMEYLGSRAAKRCYEHILDKFKRLSVEWKSKGVNLGVNESVISDYNKYMNLPDFRKLVVEAGHDDARRIKYEDKKIFGSVTKQVYETENVEYIYKKYFIDPCKVHNGIMDEFHDSVEAMEILTKRRINFSRHSEAVHATLCLFRFCKHILRITADDLAIF